MTPGLCLRLLQTLFPIKFPDFLTLPTPPTNPTNRHQHHSGFSLLERSRRVNPQPKPRYRGQRGADERKIRTDIAPVIPDVEVAVQPVCVWRQGRDHHTPDCKTNLRPQHTSVSVVRQHHPECHPVDGFLPALPADLRKGSRVRSSRRSGGAKGFSSSRRSLAGG